MSKLFTAFVAGIAVGVLLAPDKGSITRKKLVRSVTDIKDTFLGYLGEPTELALGAETPEAPVPPFFAQVSIPDDAESSATWS